MTFAYRTARVLIYFYLLFPWILHMNSLE